MAFQFKITLTETDPLVWRQILVPDEYTFYKFHMAIQGAFGWENCHLFQFCERDIIDDVAIGIPDAMDDEKTVRNATKIKVASIFKRPGREYEYVYDFGDNWHHSIVFEKHLSDEIAGPFCLDAKSACPPEDCGGIHGYQEMIKILATKGHPEGKSYLEWIGLEKNETWDPGYCSEREANKRLALL